MRWRQNTQLGSEPGSDPNFLVGSAVLPLDAARCCAQDPCMPRPPRICVPGIPLHIVQRGNDRQDCFRQRGDYLRYLGFLAKSAQKYEARVHAYVLMTNHVHLLMTPGHKHSASRMMQNLGRCYVLAFNRIHERTAHCGKDDFALILSQQKIICLRVTGI